MWVVVCRAADLSQSQVKLQSRFAARKAAGMKANVKNPQKSTGPLDARLVLTPGLPLFGGGVDLKQKNSASPLPS